MLMEIRTKKVFVAICRGSLLMLKMLPEEYNFNYLMFVDSVVDT